MNQWGILQLMGHVRIAGIISEEERFGAKVGRIDIPRENGTFSTEYFNASSIYRLQFTTEEVARTVAAQIENRPIYSYEMPRPQLTEPVREREDADDADDEHEDEFPF